jgi:TolB protein
MLMRLRAPVRAGAVLVIAGLVVSVRGQTEQAVGDFTASQDIGTPSTVGAGSAKYDPAAKTYTIAGGGVNMWASSDHFHYVWKKVSGDALLAATIDFVATHPASGTPDAHRKAVVAVRQSLDSDAAYADAAVHGDGLTSLQWRDVKGGPTRQIESMAIAPKRVRFEKRGNYVSMSVAGAGEELKPAGGSTRIDLQGEYYIGLGVTAHNTGRIETATFSDVELTTPPPLSTTTTTTQKPAMVNTLETINVRSKDRKVVYVVTQPTRVEAPNWYPDASNTLYFNTNGRLYKIQADPPGAKANPNRLKVPEAVDLGFLTRINNDHGITNDGKLWAISDQSQTINGQRPSLIYTVPFGGGPPKLVTEKGPSYFHGWSPDGKTLTYCGQRDGNFDIYTVSVDGGAEMRLTTDKGKDDGPEYSPDGQYIYFNSDRSGAMQIWRMKIDGSAQEQITNDDSENWFPHVSPNGQSIAFLTYAKGVGDHPENKDVMLKVMDLASRKVDVLTRLFGGQGTINVPSWSPNSQYLAFVSYQLIPQ